MNNFRLKPRRKVGVNLTPLIDVVFLLLIFFMVSTTFESKTRIKVTLPELSQSQPDEVIDDKITITIDADGMMSINDGLQPFNSSVSTLKRSISEIIKGNKDISMIIKADKEAPFQAVMTVMDVAGQLGLKNVTFPARKTIQEASEGS